VANNNNLIGFIRSPSTHAWAW